MLHACIQRFDVTGIIKKILDLFRLIASPHWLIVIGFGWDGYYTPALRVATI